MSDPVALVTGASGAVGRSVAAELSARQFVVAVHYHRDEVGAAATRDAIGPSLLAQADVGSWPEVRAMVHRLEAVGPLAVVVNCAGLRTQGLLGVQPVAQWHDTISVNLVGTYHVCRAAVRGMLRRRSGRIINVVSAAGLRASPGQTAYSAAKAGVVGLTRSLAAECGRRGVTVNALSPGFMDTRMTADVPEEVRSTILAMVPLGRPGEPADIAVGVRFLLDCDYVNGQVIAIDGGLTG